MSKSQGFLAESLSLSITGIRRDFASWFETAAAFNELAMTVLPELRCDAMSNQQMVAAPLFGRALTSFQATCLLAERGMVADARAILRTASETVIILCAVAKDASVCDLLVDRTFWHHRKLRLAWLNDPEAMAQTSCAEADAVRAVVRDIESTHPRVVQMKGDPVSIDALARKAGVLVLYNTVFRASSGDGAHTSLDPLNRHVRSDAAGSILGLRFGPEVAGLASTISDSISALAFALSAAVELFAVPAFQPELERCVATWKSLVAKQPLDSAATFP